jgi:acyl-CoA dehydrogenase
MRTAGRVGAPGWPSPWRIVDAAVQIFGGSGYIEESAVARHYRDVRVLRIGGGADEIQLEILSRELTP